jgi:hypothetical protein
LPDSDRTGSTVRFIRLVKGVELHCQAGRARSALRNEKDEEKNVDEDTAIRQGMATELIHVSRQTHPERILSVVSWWGVYCACSISSSEKETLDRIEKKKMHLVI